MKAKNNGRSKSFSSGPSLRTAESEGRGQAFTPNWNKSITIKESLPIKVSGKVVTTTREVVERSDDEDEEQQGSDHEIVDMEEGDEDQDNEPTQAQEEDFDDFDRPIELEDETEEAILKTQVREKKKQSESVIKARTKIASICTVVTTDPELAVKKRKHSDTEDFSFHLSDLFEYFSHPSAEIVELAMLSSVLVFKDIIPGYRIRAGADADSEDVRLKKETKKLKDFEKALLQGYQRFLKFLESKVAAGLGNVKKDIKKWGETAALGLSALRAECELIRSVPHFNFRSILIKTIVSRACQPSPNVSSLCCDTLKTLFLKDAEGELSYECVREMAAAMVNVNFQVSEEYIAILENVKVRVHADEAKNIRRKAKMERRKRRKVGDDVEAGLMEASGLVASTVQRFQADSLHELILIYFRYAL
jgi:nucleolar complex protein 3